MPKTGYRMVSPAVIVEGWEVGIFCRGAIPHWPFCWSAHTERSHKGTLESCALRMRAHPWLMLLEVRLNIEVGGFPAVRALAACWNTQLTYTDTSLRPHKHLFAERKSLCVCTSKRYDYHLVYTSFPLAFSYTSIHSIDTGVAVQSTYCDL